VEFNFRDADEYLLFPISRDPHKGGTWEALSLRTFRPAGLSFQFLGIPTKGELVIVTFTFLSMVGVSNF